MKFNVKTLLIGIGAVLGVVVVAAVLFVVFFPKDLAAREAERRIEAATGRDLVLGGPISLTFWPALGFSVDHVTLSNPQGFDTAARRGGADQTEAPFLSANRIVFAVALMPLLSGHVQVNRLIMDGADVRLRAKQDGSSNWTFPTDEQHQQNTLNDLRLDDVRLNDSMITFQGATDETPMTLEHVDAQLALQSLDSPATLTSAFNYRGQRTNVDGTINFPRAILEKRESSMTAHVQAAPLTASFDGSFNAENGALNGRLEANGASLRQLMAWMGSPMGEGGGFGAYRLTAQMAHRDNSTALTNAAINLDAIAARGNLTLLTQDNDRLRVTGALSAPSLDLNTYLPEPAQGAAAGGVAVNQGWSQDRLDLSGLRAMDAGIDLTLGSLKFQRLQFTNVALNLRLANGAADARLSRIALYGGTGTARMIADASGATPRIAVELTTQNIQAEPLLRDAIGFDKITGRGRLTASLVGSGASQAAIMRTLRGNAAFTFNDGQYKGVNLAQVARTVQAALSGQAVGASANTDFAELGATFTVADGAAATQDLHMLNPYVRIDGRGLINIGAQTIDMRLNPRAVNNAQGQGGQANLGGLGIPFRITGPWSHVRFAPALEDVVQSQLQDILRQRGGGTDNPLGALGDTLFGRSTTSTTPATPAQPAPSSGSGNTTTTPPPAEQQDQQPANPLDDILRRATQPRNRNHGSSTTTATP